MSSELPVGWEVECLENCVSAIIDYRGKSPRKTSAGVPLITARIVKDGRIDTPTEFIASADYDAWMRRGLPESGDVLITTEAPLGEVAQLDDIDVALAQRLILLRGDPARLQNDYLKYALQSSFVQSQLKARSTGTTVLGIRQSELRKVVLPLPPLGEQRRIADTLGALDDKIELNRRMSRTSESIARAIFKSWFVDFDPVRKKMEGKEGGEVGLPPDLAALFPDCFQESALGPVPLGWEVRTCASEFGVTMGQSPPGDTYNEGGEGLPFFQGRRDFASRYPTRRVFCTSPKRFARSGDALVSVRAPVGDVNTAIERCCIGRGVAAVRHRSGAVAYTYETMRSLRDEFADFEAGGTVFGSISGRDFANLLVVGPPPAIVSLFEDLVAPVESEIRTLHENARVITNLRDSLLPRLMQDGCTGATSGADDRAVGADCLGF